MILPVRIWGMGYDGRLFSEDVETVDITPAGARLRGVSVPVQRGAIIGIQHGKVKARFRVAWVGEPGTPKAGQIGVHLAELGKYIWGTPLRRTMGDPQVLPAARLSLYPDR
jgi:hypothetical protein